MLFTWTWVSCLWGDRQERMKGQGMVEYALILVLVAIAVVAVLATMGNRISAAFQNIVGCLDVANAATCHSQSTTPGTPAT